MRRVGACAVAVLIWVALIAPGASAFDPSAQPPRPAPGVVPITAQITDDDNELSAESLAQDAIQGAIILIGVGLGIGGNKWLDDKKAKQEKRNDRAKDLDALVDTAQGVLSKVRAFVDTTPTLEALDALESDLQTLLTGSERLEPSAVRAKVREFISIARPALRNPKLADELLVKKLATSFESLRAAVEAAKARLHAGEDKLAA